MAALIKVFQNKNIEEQRHHYHMHKQKQIKFNGEHC
jgi:hypothetical protein